jgi:predicted signal transduction protein with EAL and GGDEF domain
MVAPLGGDQGAIGYLVVANRLGEASTYEEDDLRLLETLAGQVAVALQNGQLEQSLAELSRLKDELRHQAYHDSLTRLGNRALLTEAVERRLAAPTPDRMTAVLFLDLDDFKIVNDTLGHAVGDELLAAVADRIIVRQGRRHRRSARWRRVRCPRPRPARPQGSLALATVSVAAADTDPAPRP